VGKMLRFKAIEDAKRAAGKDLHLLRQAIEASGAPEYFADWWRSVIEHGDPKDSNRYLCTFVQGDMKWVGIAAWDGRYWLQNGRQICNGSGEEPCYVSHWIPIDPVSQAHSWRELHAFQFNRK
jgi:hypothetical protein